MSTTDQSLNTAISDPQGERERSRRLAERYRCPFVDLFEQRIDAELFRSIPAESLTRDSAVSPVVRLVDTVIFTALERRASDIHIEARDIEIAVKYRIDGVLVHAMAPISKDWLSTIISRIKVMSELDIAERRVPQDGRFRVRYKGRFVDFRVSIMPS